MAPDNGQKTEIAAVEAPEQRSLFVRVQRRKLPDERKSVTHKFAFGGQEGYIIVGMYAEGAPGEIFIKMAKEGSTLSGFMDGLALSISIGLQYGVQLKALVDKLTNTRFEPSGLMENPSIRVKVETRRRRVELGRSEARSICKTQGSTGAQSA
jgi:ribonucleoside-diphosphate reductase alpha chain